MLPEVKHIYPGVENLLVSEHTAISQVATNWQPAAVAKPFTYIHNSNNYRSNNLKSIL